MRTRTWRRVFAPAALALALLVAALGGASVASAADAAQQTPAAQATGAAQAKQVERQVVVEFGKPVVVHTGERVQTVVAFGGDITVAGTVDETVVAFGGDVTLRSTAVVGKQTKSGDSSVVVINGRLHREKGATVVGPVEVVDLGGVGDAVQWARERGGWQAFSPFVSFVGWLVATVVFLLLGLLAAAVMPGQIRAVEGQIARRPGASLGWGALNVFLVVPATLLVLAITIIGLIVVVPAVLFVLPLFTVFVLTAVGAFVVERLLGTQLRGNLVAAVAIAVLATSIVGRVPVVGGLVIVAMVVIGTGASVLAWNAWRLERKALRAGGAPADGPAGTGGAPPALPPYASQGDAVAPPAQAQPGAATAPYAQPPSGASPYVQPPSGASPYAPPPIADAPVGTQAYFHPEYGWVVSAPPETAAQEGEPQPDEDQ